MTKSSDDILDHILALYDRDGFERDQLILHRDMLLDIMYNRNDSRPKNSTDVIAFKRENLQHNMTLFPAVVHVGTSDIALHRRKKGTMKTLPNVSDIVLVKESNVPRSQWDIGKILNLDRRRAVAEIWSPRRNTTIYRSVGQLHPLELDCERPESLQTTTTSTSDSGANTMDRAQAGPSGIST